MSDNKFEVLGDDSLKKTTGGVARGSRDSSDVQRQDTDGTVLSQSERRRLFRSEWEQQALPTPPPIPGYHLCWLSTTSSYDPIHKRMRLGYEPVKASEIPGFESFEQKAGEWKGFISANEMLLFKLPEEIYQDIMAEFHHYQPMEQEEALKSGAVQQQTDSNGKQLVQVEGDGLASLGTRSKTPHFD